MPEPQPDLSPKTWDEVKTTTCYMCACRCGIKVYLKDGTRPLHRGQPRPSGQQGRALRQGCGRHHAALLAGPAVASRCCGSGARGSGEFREIDWEEALAHRDAVAVARSAAPIPSKLAFFTGRDQ